MVLFSCKPFPFQTFKNNFIKTTLKTHKLLIVILLRNVKCMTRNRR